MGTSTPIMDLARELQSKVESERLHISLPVQGWTFSSDNATDISGAFAQVMEESPVFVRQFTNIDSEKAFANGKGWVPVKRLAAFLLLPEEGDFHSLTKSETESAYCTDFKSGDPLEKPLDLIFVDGLEMLRIIKSEH